MPRIRCDSRRKKRATLLRAWPDALFIDVTSRGEEPWVGLSPFFPHGEIPVPFTPGRVAASVEGVWQGLKVFDSADVDERCLDNRKMRGIKRTSRKHGRVLGHRKGVHGNTLLSYVEARWAIYLPTYRFVLEHRLEGVVAKLANLARAQPVVLLDYETNGDVDDLSRPLSHAALVAAHVNDAWPVRT